MTTEFQQTYQDLLIIQYRDKPNALAEIGAMASTMEPIRDFLRSIPDAFDIDLALSAQLTVLGKLIGLPRNSRPEFAVTEDYRFYCKVRIAKNFGAAYMIRDTGNSIQDVIAFAFDNLAYVVDNYDMSMTLYADTSVPTDRIALLAEADLLPKPQGVRYKSIVYAPLGGTFGFSNNVESRGFADKFDPSRIGGYLARKVL